MHRVGDPDLLPSFALPPPRRCGVRGTRPGRRRGDDLDPGNGSAAAPGNRVGGGRRGSLCLAIGNGSTPEFAAWLRRSSDGERRVTGPLDGVLACGAEGDSLARHQPSHRDRESEPTATLPRVLDGPGHGDPCPAHGGPARHRLRRWSRLRGGRWGCGRHRRCGGRGRRCRQRGRSRRHDGRRDCIGSAPGQQDPNRQNDRTPARQIKHANRPSFRGRLLRVGLAGGPRVRASRWRVDAP